MPGSEEVRGVVLLEDCRTVLQGGALLDRRALVRNFVQGIDVAGGEATAHLPASSKHGSS